MDPGEENQTAVMSDPTGEDSMGESTDQQEQLYSANTPLILDTSAISINNGSVMDTQNVIVTTTGVTGTEATTTRAITIGSQMYIIQSDPTQDAEGNLDHQAFVLQPEDIVSSVSSAPTTQGETISMQSAGEEVVLGEGGDAMTRVDYVAEPSGAVDGTQDAGTFQSLQVAEEGVAGDISPGRHRQLQVTDFKI